MFFHPIWLVCHGIFFPKFNSLGIPTTHICPYSIYIWNYVFFFCYTYAHMIIVTWLCFGCFAKWANFRPATTKVKLHFAHSLAHTVNTQIKIIIRFYFIVCEVYPVCYSQSALQPAATGFVMKAALRWKKKSLNGFRFCPFNIHANSMEKKSLAHFCPLWIFRLHDLWVVVSAYLWMWTLRAGWLLPLHSVHLSVFTTICRIMFEYSMVFCTNGTPQNVVTFCNYCSQF